MFERLDDAVFVIDDDVADRVSDFSQVEIYGGHAALGQHVHYRWLDLRSQNGNAGHLQTEQSSNGVQRALGVVVGVEYQRVHLVRERLILEGGGYFGEERVAHIGDNQAEERAGAAGEIARGLILRIAQLAYGG